MRVTRLSVGKPRLHPRVKGQEFCDSLLSSPNRDVQLKQAYDVRQVSPWAPNVSSSHEHNGYMWPVQRLPANSQALLLAAGDVGAAVRPDDRLIAFTVLVRDRCSPSPFSSAINRVTTPWRRPVTPTAASEQRDRDPPCDRPAGPASLGRLAELLPADYG